MAANESKPLGQPLGFIGNLTFRAAHIRDQRGPTQVRWQIAKDADKLESLLQAVEYQAQGYDTTPWQETSVTALRTDAGRQLARAIMAADPHSWWSNFAASYHELRKEAKGRARKRRRPEG